MKIGILTFHRAINLGAVLQASALLKYVQDECGECEIIDFYPNNEIPYDSCVRKLLHFCKQILTFPKALKRQKKEKKYEEYRKKYYIMSKESYFGDKELKEKNPKYDVLISGSDQILNTDLTGRSTSFYLDFNTEAKKVSYASSFGRTDITETEISLVKRELPKFQKISVREQSAGEIIEREIGRNVQMVMDPVFLLKKEEWCNRCDENLILPEKYIFVYSMEVSQVLEHAVDRLAEVYGLPVIVVRGGGQPGRIQGKEDVTCGPAGFLRYVRDAEIVVTNSFHGTAFSIIFEKKFIAIAHSTRNTRLENIMKLIGRIDVLLKETNIDFCIDNYIVDGERAADSVVSQTELSKQFLQDALKFI